MSDVIETIQRIRRKVFSLAAINGYTMFGIALVMALFIFVTGQDVINIASGSFPF